MNQRRENSIRSLVNLYTVVIGVALSLSVVQLVNRPEGVLSIAPHEALLFAAFVSTLIPFYHGALRHLDDTYLENRNLHIRDGALILDVVLLLAHGMVFVILALLLNNPSQFAWLLLLLILVDVVWGIFTHFGSSTPAGDGAEGKWTLINALFVVVLGVSLYMLGIDFNSDVNETKLALSLAVACALRSLVDYSLCWQFYFPQDANPDP